MDLSKLKSNTRRKTTKRVGRGGKRGTYSGKGMKGQKSRSGSGITPGFRGGDNRIWQLFPKKRGASKKHGNKSPHRKHRYYRFAQQKPDVFNLSFFNQFSGDEIINKEFLNKHGFISNKKTAVKVLGNGDIKKKLEFEGLDFSKSARTKITKLGGSIK